MPNVTAPASFAYSGGAIRCARVVPTRLAYSTTSIATTRDTPITTAADIPSLDRLTRWDRPEGWEAQNWERFMAIWQKKCEAIEEAFEAVNARVDEVALYARLNAVEALAEAANDNATQAKATADTVSTATQQTFTDIDPNLGDSFGDLVTR